MERCKNYDQRKLYSMTLFLQNSNNVKYICRKNCEIIYTRIYGSDNP